MEYITEYLLYNYILNILFLSPSTFLVLHYSLCLLCTLKLTVSFSLSFFFFFLKDQFMRMKRRQDNNYRFTVRVNFLDDTLVIFIR